MPTRPFRDLEEIAAVVEIHSADHFAVAGRPCTVGAARPAFAPSYSLSEEELAGGPASAALLAALIDQLYARWFTRARPPAEHGPDPLAYRRHLHQLSDAHRGGWVWEPGWKVRRVADGGRLVVEKLGLAFYVAEDEVRLAQGSPAAGLPCRVRVPAEMRRLPSGFWTASGDADPGEPGGEPWLLRLYWHLRPWAAPRLVRVLSAGLNRRRIPFRLKLVADPGFYRRADAGVLYLEPSHYRRARPVVRRAYREVRSELRAEVPRLTARLAPGLGWCEGPADGESFGTHRCRWIARALVGAFHSGAATAPARLAAIVAAFRQVGLDPRRPHLAAGSRSSYRPLPPADVSPPTRRAREAASAPGPTAGGGTAPAECAAAIGDELCRRAYRDAGRCNWIGASLAPAPSGAGYQPAVAALGPDLYGGTSGIALFLAELHAVTGDGTHRRTAVAAQRQALEAISAEPRRWPRAGFYEGQLGVAWAAWRVAWLAASDELGAAARRQLSELAPGLGGEGRADVLSGGAGAILALLGLYRETGRPDFLQAAARVGRELAAAPEPSLAGFAHGAAGVGLALLELAAATGSAPLRDAADRVFAWEDARFDSRHRNWPDLRPLPAAPRPAPDAEPRFMVAWCHGAAGIALSRLRAMEVDPSRSGLYESAARAGLETTIARLEAEIDRPDADACLCHGLAGWIEVARIAAHVLADADLRRRVDGWAGRLASIRPLDQVIRFADPSLLTGAAGVGHALLRLARPGGLPSLLLPGALPAAAGARHGASLS